MKDTDLMPFGKYKGLKMGNVPSYYLIYIYENQMIPEQYREVAQYIFDNWDVLEEG